MYWPCFWPRLLCLQRLGEQLAEVALLPDFVRIGSITFQSLFSSAAANYYVTFPLLHNELLLLSLY